MILLHIQCTELLLYVLHWSLGTLFTGEACHIKLGKTWLLTLISYYKLHIISIVPLLTQFCLPFAHISVSFSVPLCVSKMLVSQNTAPTKWCAMPKVWWNIGWMKSCSTKCQSLLRAPHFYRSTLTWIKLRTTNLESRRSYKGKHKGHSMLGLAVGVVLLQKSQLWILTWHCFDDTASYDS